MNRTIVKLLALAVLSAAGTQVAWADGTTAGTSISNKATVNYTIGTTPQTPINSNGDTDTTFVVDRKVNVTMTAGTAVAVNAGATQQMLTFEVTNSSNATLDFALSADNGTSDDGDILTSSIKIFVDDGDDAYDAGDVEQLTLGDLLADESRTVFVFVDIPASAGNTDSLDVVLTASAIEPASPPAGKNAGDPVTADDAIADTATLQTVFADGAGASDNANEGDFSAAGTFTVSAPTIGVTKSFTVISDPVTTAMGGANPKAIPGAVIQYCITVSNTGGGAAADVKVDDPIPGSTTYVDGSIRVGTDCDYGDGGNTVVDDDAIGTDDAVTEAVIGNKDGTGIHTRVKDVPGGTDTTTMFQVTID